MLDPIGAGESLCKSVFVSINGTFLETLLEGKQLLEGSFVEDGDAKRFGFIVF